MNYANGDLWRFSLDPNNRIVIPICRTLKADGNLVMGKGLANDARKVYPELPREWGLYQRTCPDRLLRVYRNLFGLPTKYNYRNPSDLDLITAGLVILRNYVQSTEDSLVYLPQLGCGCGELEWKDVRPIMERILNTDQFTVVIYQ